MYSIRRQRRSRTTYGALALSALLGVAPPAFANNPRPTPEELAWLPEWCLYHSSIIKNQPRHPVLEQIHASGCGGVHHYCWALVNAGRGDRANNARDRRVHYGLAIPNIDYTVNSSKITCVLLPTMYAKYGELYSKLDNHHKAVSFYRKAIAQNPKYDLAYSGLCGAYLRQEQYDEALQTLREGLAANPKSLLLKKRLADLEARQGARRSDPDTPPAGD